MDESRKDEVEDLGKNFNSCIETMGTVEQITKNIGNLANQISSQSAVVEQSSASIHQMVASIGTIKPHREI